MVTMRNRRGQNLRLKKRVDKRNDMGLVRHALRLSRASGVPIEQFVGEEDDLG